MKSDYYPSKPGNKQWIFLSIISFIAMVLSAVAIIWSYNNGHILAYGDAESHLNIAKRVVDSITPGLAQLGGIWLPLPHILMAPLVSFNVFWRTGLAGSVIGSISYIVTAVFLFKLIYLVSKNIPAALVGTLVFLVNPNILYLGTTAMTEIPLIAFFTISIYYFVRFLYNDKETMSLVLASLFGLAATLSRYDGWFLVAVEAGIIALNYGKDWFKLWRKSRSIENRKLNHLSKKKWSEMEGRVFLFITLAFIGIFLWLLWDLLILKDPLYFTNSPFSAKSQQKGWLLKGELPAYHNWLKSIEYYSYTVYKNIGDMIAALVTVGLLAYIFDFKIKSRFFILLLLFVPYFFYILTLYIGQSVIFIPGLTPDNFEWDLFNVRYGVMMVVPAAFFIGYLCSRLVQNVWFEWINYPPLKKRKDMFLMYFSRVITTTFFVTVFLVVIFTISLQAYRFYKGLEPVISFQDAVSGLSSAKDTDAQKWLAANYDGGYVLIDDYARTLSVIKSGIPMENVIYIGNKPYWEESLAFPERHSRWIIMQEGDIVWKTLYEDTVKQGQLYSHFEKAYTSPEILVFKRSDNNAISSVKVDF